MTTLPSEVVGRWVDYRHEQPAYAGIYLCRFRWTSRAVASFVDSTNPEHQGLIHRYLHFAYVDDRDVPYVRQSHHTRINFTNAGGAPDYCLLVYHLEWLDLDVPAAYQPRCRIPADVIREPLTKERP